MFAGSIVALATPMARDGALDLAGFATLLERHLSHGTDAVVIGGTTGESPTLSPDELEQLLRDARAIVGDRMPLIAGSGTYNTRTSIALTKRACDAGADACLVVTP